MKRTYTKTTLLVLALSLFLPASQAWAETEIVTVETEGRGKSPEEALNAALSAAIAKVNGVSIKSSSRSVSGQASVKRQSQSQSAAVIAGRVDTQSAAVMKTRQYKDGEKPPAADVKEGAVATTTRVQGAMVSATASKSQDDMQYSATHNDTSKKTAGQIKTYDILATTQFDGGYAVRISASITKYKLSAEAKRTRIAVIPFRSKIRGRNAIEFERDFSQVLVSHLTQSNKFAVLDRDYLSEQGAELGRLQMGEVSIDEMAKLGNKLGTDYILVGSIDDVISRRHSIVMKSTGKEIPMIDQGARLSFRLINASTGQVKFSDNFDNVDTRQGNAVAMVTVARLAGKNIAQNIVMNFYPVMVEGMDGETLVVGQGGDTLNQGQRMRLVQYGEEVFDSYTKESLGRSERPVGVVEIIEVSTKQSYAKIVRASIDMSNSFAPQGYILRPMPQPKTNVNKAKRAQDLKAKAKERLKKLKEKSDVDY